MADALDEYRRHLIAAEQKSQEDYDKTVLLLSGGALGLSLTFVDKIVGGDPIACAALLYVGWVAWTLSVACVLISYYCSVLALRKAIQQVDSKAIHASEPGGSFSVAINVFNAAGGMLFILGVFFVLMFASQNIGGKPNAKAAQTTTAETKAAPGTGGPGVQAATSSPTAQEGDRIKPLTETLQPTAGIK